MIEPARVRRVYVRLPNWVGDVALATPLLRALRQALPHANLVAHGRARLFEILRGEGLYDVEVALEKRGGPLWPVLEGRRVRRVAGRPDVAFVLPNSFSSALTAFTTGARVRVGYELNGRGLLLSHGLAVAKVGRLRPIPMVDYYLGLLRRVGLPCDGVARRPTLTITPAARERASAYLARQGIAAGARVWAINLGGSWETKRWIPGHAGALCRLLRERGVVPLLLRGPGEEALTAATCAAAGCAVAGSEELVPLGDLTAVLSACELLVTTDSGPRHFGVAAGIPVLVLVGSTHPGYTQVDYAPLRLLCEEVSCWPCHLKRCPIDFRCMHALGPERVLAAAEALRSEHAAAPAGEPLRCVPRAHP